jgi:hypothetical protein
VANDPVMETRALAAVVEREHQVGWNAGYQEAQADMAAAWRAIANPVAHRDAHLRSLAYQGVRAALKGEREDATEHERAFVARAHNTQSAQRNDVEQATVRLYPPPQQQWRAA